MQWVEAENKTMLPLKAPKRKPLRTVPLVPLDGGVSQAKKMAVEYFSGDEWMGETMQLPAIAREQVHPEAHSDSSSALSRLNEVNPIILPVRTNWHTGRMGTQYISYEDVGTAVLPVTTPLAILYDRLLLGERWCNSVFLGLLSLLALGILGVLGCGYLLSLYGVTA
jgi:hypothetical protein